ncbi:hypothetical protein AALP_AA8G489100 [Arabis alpina]|uniref:Uncharacterized protein n=1 Tax=Arabis alpina TaxID=50452 RepID=A0A087GEC7_ARAAL|nr:hypothetical protein AALP_AA8G489100 [Arabis alpina]
MRDEARWSFRARSKGARPPRTKNLSTEDEHRSASDQRKSIQGIAREESDLACRSTSVDSHEARGGNKSDLTDLERIKCLRAKYNETELALSQHRSKPVTGEASKRNSGVKVRRSTWGRIAALDSHELDSQFSQ